MPPWRLAVVMVEIFSIVCVGLAGLIFGSFMNVLVYRLPRGKSIVFPGSSCIACGHKIKPYENIPVLSWVFLRGRCSGCGERISLRYPLIELITCALFVLLILKFGLTLQFFKYTVFAYLALAAAATDLDTALDKQHFETGVIPDVYVYCGIAFALAFGIFEGNFINTLAGCAAGYLVLLFPAVIYAKLRGIEGIGEGDFGFLAMIGAFTGAYSVPMVLVVASLLGVIIGGVTIIITKNTRYALPFAPMLAVGGLLCVFFDDLAYINILF